MDAATAKEIITQARKDETYAGPMPEDDAGCIKAADELVEMAKQAWEQYIRGPEVEIILKLAANGDAPAAETKPAEKPAETPVKAPPAEAGPEAAATPDDENETAPPQDLSDVPDNLKKVEPWEGYNEDRVSDITEGINICIQGDDDPAELLGHIWAYESSHKNRVRILKHVKESWEKVNVQTTASTATPTDSEADPELAPEKAPSAPAAQEESGPPVRSEQELPQAAQAEAAPSDAPAQPVGKTGPSSSEGGEHDEAKQAPKDPYRVLIQGVDRQLQNERLDIPKPPSEPTPELPWKWADITNTDLHDMHMQFASMAYYKSYQQTRDERIAIHCREAADELQRALMLKSEKYDEKGKQKTVTLLEAEIESDDNVKKWRKLQRKHEQFAAASRRELDSYQKLVEALSRLETMRDNAWRRSQAK